MGRRKAGTPSTADGYAASKEGAVKNCNVVMEHELHALKQEVDGPDCSVQMRMSEGEEDRLAAQLTQDIHNMMVAQQAQSQRVQSQDAGLMEHRPEAGQDLGSASYGQEQVLSYNQVSNPVPVAEEPPEPHTAQHMASELQAEAQLLLMAPDSQREQRQHHYIQQQPQLHSQGPTQNFHQPPQTGDANFGGAAQYGQPDHVTPPRKRSKVSRACDECRRKKIRCGAPPEGSTLSCSNCRKSKAKCEFTRMPQKRGPSKGYIKELADRIISIEGKLGSSGESGEALQAIRDAFSPELENARKRPFSGTSNDEAATMQQRPIAAAQPSPPYDSNNHLAPRPAAPLVPAYGLLQPAADMLGAAPHASAVTADQGLREMDEVAFESYLETVHPTLPVLARTKARVQATLSQCPGNLQQAFCQALWAMVQAMQLNAVHNHLERANQLVKRWELEHGFRPTTKALELVRLQTLVMMVMAAENSHAIPAVRELKCSLLRQAADLGLSMKLHMMEVPEAVADKADMDADVYVALRTWWTLVMLDRWHAIGTAAMPMIDNGSVVIMPGLKHVLGEAVYHFVGLAFILGHVAPLCGPQAKNWPAEAGPPLHSMVSALIELWRAQLPSHIGPAQYPVVHLAFWHLRLLQDINSTRRSPAWARGLLQTCRDLVGVLKSQTLRHPLTHHFSSLLVLTLMELHRGVDLGGEEAATLLSEIVAVMSSPSTHSVWHWDSTMRDRITAGLHGPRESQSAAQKAVDEGINADAESVGSSGLQALVDSYRFDRVKILSGGYLQALGGDPYWKL